MCWKLFTPATIKCLYRKRWKASIKKLKCLPETRAKEIKYKLEMCYAWAMYWNNYIDIKSIESNDLDGKGPLKEKDNIKSNRTYFEEEEKKRWRETVVTSYVNAYWFDIIEFLSNIWNKNPWNSFRNVLNAISSGVQKSVNSNLGMGKTRNFSMENSIWAGKKTEWKAFSHSIAFSCKSSAMNSKHHTFKWNQT